MQLLLMFILGGICGVITTATLTAKSISRAENDTFNQCLNDAQRSFGRGWKGSEDR